MSDTVVEVSVPVVKNKGGRPRKVLTEEEVKARKEKRNAQKREWYAEHREAVRTRAKELYDPTKKAQYYWGNHSEVLASQRKHYMEKMTTEKVERLQALLAIAPDEAIARMIANHIESPEEIKMSEVLTLEKSVLLTIHKLREADGDIITHA